ncbi:hypothetical protein [Alkaliphilus metalliredigens]|nr:hypothetical protein [Alkaliphilus metalliredigens]
MTQLLLWITLIAPWFVLFFLDLKRVKHFLSVAFFTIVLTSIFWQVAEIWNWWEITNNLFFLTNISAFNYGLLPVITILVFYYTYQNKWLFFGTNIIIDAIQAFIISPFIFEKFGLYQMVNMGNFGLYLLLLGFVPIIYLYQRWYDK